MLGSKPDRKAICQCIHRNLLLAPLMGLENRLGRHCVPVMQIPPMQQSQDKQGEGDMYTWKPANSVFATLIKHTHSNTAIYLHDSDMHYAASEAASLGPACPLNTVLLAQVILDQEENGEFATRILVFDALQIGQDDFVQAQLPPTERYTRLRELCMAPHVLAQPEIMMVQWAGPCLEIVHEFSMGKNASINLPNHVAEAVIKLGVHHPCKLLVLV